MSMLGTLKFQTLNNIGYAKSQTPNKLISTPISKVKKFPGEICKLLIGEALWLTHKIQNFQKEVEKSECPENRETELCIYKIQNV